MAFLKFNKSELVNLSYSLKREILCANKTGAYCNTSIVTCNTRRYHGLLAVTLDRFGGDRFLLLSDVDETLIVNGKQFNLGIHCYGDMYEPRGHKYVVDFSADPVPQITYKVGEILFRKSIVLAQDRDQVLVKYERVRRRWRCSCVLSWRSATSTPSRRRTRRPTPPGPRSRTACPTACTRVSPT